MSFNLLVNVINMEINSHNGLVRIQAHSLTLTGLIQELQIHLFLNSQGTGSGNERKILGNIIKFHMADYLCVFQWIVKQLQD